MKLIYIHISCGLVISFYALILYLDLSGLKGRVKVETSIAVERIESIAYRDGLPPDQLVNLVKLASSGKYG